MKYIKYKEINSQKWDALLNSVPKVHFYFLYNYLSSICKWDAIVLENENEYDLILPIPFKQKLWLKYFYQPFFCQQLGIVARNEVSRDQLIKIKNILKKEFSFGLANWRFFNIVNEEFNNREKINYTLTLLDDYQVLKQNYNSNRKRVLKKLLKKEYEVELSEKTEDINKTISRFSQVFASAIKEITPTHYEKLKVALKSIENSSKISVSNVKFEGKILSSALFVNYQNRIVYLLGYTESGHRKESVQTLIFDNLVQAHQNSNKVLDFEGGSSVGIGRFYSSIGGVKSPYLEITSNSDHFIFKKIFR